MSSTKVTPANLLLDHNLFSHNKQVFRLRAPKYIKQYRVDRCSPSLIKHTKKYVKASYGLYIAALLFSRCGRSALSSIAAHFCQTVRRLKIDQFNFDGHFFRPFTRLKSLSLPQEQSLDHRTKKTIKSLKLKYLFFNHALCSKLGWLSRTRSLEGLSLATRLNDFISPQNKMTPKRPELQYNVSLNSNSALEAPSLDSMLLGHIKNLRIENRSNQPSLSLFLSQSKELKNLKSLSYQGEKLTANSEDLSQLENVPKLESLKLDLENYQSDLIRYTRLPKRLKRLSLSFKNNLDEIKESDESQPFFKSLASIGHLQAFEAIIKKPEGRHDPQVYVKFFKILLNSIQSVESLTLKGDFFSLSDDEILEMIFKHKRLTELNLDFQIRPSNRKAEIIRRFNGKLKKLTLKNNLYLFNNLREESLTDLKSLSLTFEDFSSHDENQLLHHISKMKNLRELYITDGSAYAVSKAKIMKIFEATESMKRLQRLKVNAENAEFNSQDIEMVTNCFKWKKRLQQVEINLSEYFIERDNDDLCSITKKPQLYVLDYIS